MQVRKPLSFTVTHVGRGGSVTCRSEAFELALPIEAELGGSFSVWLRGVRLTSTTGSARSLRADERQFVKEQLRAWLTTTGRESWTIEL